ncbi:DEAD box ATP dependent RNA helicase [Echinococcus multilocularis]|uniref:DEAD box ATP dependent RNA helicase n=1 Tax=Echinococcus multilocularis TaxID=6211 RepID=A0A087VY49_ECHMU|nr:DEAD box ATP dependent RNA helicase [Echinococcus multilocularis]
MDDFLSLGLCASLTKCCNDLGWKNPLPIQVSSIPPSLKGNDIIGTSETGSGKTAAFLLPILQHWLSSGRPKGYALVLAPTRELALQITDTANVIMSNFVDEDGKIGNPLIVSQLIGGVCAADQAVALAWCRHHFIVATPGRLAEHIKQSSGFALHHLSTIKHLVLDEADRMLSLEFADDLDLLLNLYERPTTFGSRGAKGDTFLEKRAKEVAEVESGHIEESVILGMKRTKYPHPQTYLFTATMNKDVRSLRRIALRWDAVICTATTSNQMLSKSQPIITVDLPAGLSHYCLPTRRVDKLACLEWLLEKKGDVQALVFCARCHETRFLAAFLVERGYRALGLMGKMKQVERRRVLAEFVAGKANILVATDVASRGLDLPFVALVINYGVPLTTKSYRHRVGRTARAGRCGIAVTMVTRDEGKAYLDLESVLLPTKPREPRRCIPRWPYQLPPEKGKQSDGEVGMETRRRLAEEAWSRAAKAIREEEARRLAEEEKKRKDYSIDSSSEGGGNDGDEFDAIDEAELAHQSWASGAAGIAAYVEAMLRRKQRRRNKRTTMEGSEGENAAEVKSDADSEVDEERGNLHFDQPIKEKRAAKRRAMNQKKMRLR